MILTQHGMHVRQVLTLDEVTGVAVVTGYGHPEQRRFLHAVRIIDLRPEKGIEELRAARDEYLRSAHATSPDSACGCRRQSS